MDTQLDWLSSVASDHTRLAPPPVSFGSTASLPAAHQHAVSPDMRPGSTGASPGPAPSDDSVPLSLTAQELTLEESKTYMRWYLDILARTNQRTITMNDVYHFLSNFRLGTEVKQKINRLFAKMLALINIGEFFALLRVVSHTLEGREPARLLVRVRAPVPVPPLILLKKRHSDDDAHSAQPPQPAPSALDLDLFTQFILTGHRPDDPRPQRLKKLKSVKFSDQIVSDVHDTVAPALDDRLDYLLPMDQLLLRLQAGAPLSPDPEEKQILADMAPQINHFHNLSSVDTMLVDGVPAPIHDGVNSPQSLPLHNGAVTPLQPNMTGPAQMRHMVHLPPPLRPNVTGPADMARRDPSAPPVSLQSFTAHMTPATAANTSANARLVDPARPPVPARRARLLSLPDPVHLPPPPMTAPPTFGQRSVSLSPVPPPLPPKSPPSSTPRAGLLPPPPPSRRRGSSLASSPAPLASIDSALNTPSNPLYQHSEASSSTANILDDLKALQEEVDRIRNMTGGF